MNTRVEIFQKEIISREEALLTRLSVKDRLLKICSTSEGMKKFAETFYFIRYNFYKLNFIVGARSGPDELYWKGLAENLREELGGEEGVTHNELYRIFLREVGVMSEEDLNAPVFTKEFNKIWEDYCYKAPFMETLSAIAIYEVLDNPDYQLLLNVAQHSGVGKEGLVFFAVHAKAAHFEMFEDFAETMLFNKENETVLRKAADFVHNSQANMWENLLTYLELELKLSTAQVQSILY